MLDVVLKPLLTALSEHNHRDRRTRDQVSSSAKLFPVHYLLRKVINAY